MSPKIRLGSVNYLNCRPLVHGLGGEDDRDFTLRFDPPSVCAALLNAGEIDLGLIPTIAYGDRQGDCIVPGVRLRQTVPSLRLRSSRGHRCPGFGPSRSTRARARQSPSRGFCAPAALEFRRCLLHTRPTWPRCCASMMRRS